MGKLIGYWLCLGVVVEIWLVFVLEMLFMLLVSFLLEFGNFVMGVLVLFMFDVGFKV